MDSLFAVKLWKQQNGQGQQTILHLPMQAHKFNETGSDQKNTNPQEIADVSYR